MNRVILNMTGKVNISNVHREILISEVQSRPSLWNDGHPDYKKTETTDKLWGEIGLAMGFPGKKKLIHF